VSPGGNIALTVRPVIVATVVDLLFGIQLGANHERI
jgi:hypothetical protein